MATHRLSQTRPKPRRLQCPCVSPQQARVLLAPPRPPRRRPGNYSGQSANPPPRLGMTRSTPATRSRLPQVPRRPPRTETARKGHPRSAALARRWCMRSSPGTLGSGLNSPRVPPRDRARRSNLRRQNRTVTSLYRPSSRVSQVSKHPLLPGPPPGHHPGRTPRTCSPPRTYRGRQRTLRGTRAGRLRALPCFSWGPRRARVSSRISFGQTLLQRRLLPASPANRQSRHRTWCLLGSSPKTSPRQRRSTRGTNDFRNRC
mmetsp:Transcript_5725/g.21681  ORF Transcript_5725/g.21681 Transcript_5725/m.21681 type:complete len:259 (-) Transcript_5725:1193-1969(-)